MPESLFEKHLNAGFDQGWGRDIPEFTAEDWRDLIILGYKIESLPSLVGLPTDDESYPRLHKLYQEIHDSIPPAFWASLVDKKPKERDEVHTAYGCIGIPLGWTFTGTPGLPSTFDAVFEKLLEGHEYSPSLSPSSKQKFSQGLRLAILSFDGSTAYKEIFGTLLRLAYEVHQPYYAPQKLTDVSAEELMLLAPKCAAGDKNYLNLLSALNAAIALRTDIQTFKNYMESLKDKGLWKPDSIDFALDTFVYKDIKNWFETLKSLEPEIAALSPAVRKNFFEYHGTGRLSDELRNEKLNFAEDVVAPILNADPVKDRTLLRELFNPKNKEFFRWSETEGLYRLELVTPDSSTDFERQFTHKPKLKEIIAFSEVITVRPADNVRLQQLLLACTLA